MYVNLPTIASRDLSDILMWLFLAYVNFLCTSRHLLLHADTFFMIICLAIPAICLMNRVGIVRKHSPLFIFVLARKICISFVFYAIS
jgi:hypothetical protein